MVCGVRFLSCVQLKYDYSFYGKKEDNWKNFRKFIDHIQIIIFQLLFQYFL